jgi:hypothetical protein
MAEPGWALVVAAIGLIDMQATTCPTGCLAPRREPPALALSTGAVLYRGDREGVELYLRRDTGTAFGPFGLSYGLSVTSRGAVWAGAGIVQKIDLPASDAYVAAYFMPGLYLRGDGVDLGGPVNARAGVEVGWRIDGGARIGLSVDHRSHGGIFARNPGVETVQLRVTFPTR